MAVLMPNCALSALVRARPLGRDARGRAVPSSDDAVTARGPFPGSAYEQSDHTWRLRADIRLWPLEAGDVLSDGARTWLVVTARPVQVPGAPDVDSVSIVATLDPPAHL